MTCIRGRGLLVVWAVLVGLFAIAIYPVAAQAQSALPTHSSQAATPSITSSGKVIVAHPNAVVHAGATPASIVAYLKSIEGNHTLSGQEDGPNSAPSTWNNTVHDITGKYPGIWGGDFAFAQDDINNRQTIINEAKTQWSDGSLVSLMWHVCPPTISEPCDWTQVESQDGALSTSQWQQLVTNGSALNTAWKNRLAEIVPYLKQLQNAGIPVLWRLFHEINDGWSWWGGTPYTAQLYQISYDYLTNTAGLTNLIWVWNTKDSGSPSNLSEYYPGDQYVDIVTLDPWDNGFPPSDWYSTIQNIAGSKPIALSEVGPLPSPSQLASQADWTYFSVWIDYLTSSNSNDQINAIYDDPEVLSRGDFNVGGGSPPPPTHSGPITGYEGLCVDVRGAGTTNLTPVQVYTCNGTKAQSWTVGSNNTLESSGKCLDVDGAGTSAGTTVDLYDCNGTGAQTWVAQADGALLNPNSGKCLDDTGWSTKPGTQLQIWDCTGNANQQWTLPTS